MGAPSPPRPHTLARWPALAATAGEPSPTRTSRSTDVSEHLAEPSAVVWIDLLAPQQDELQLVAEELGLHDLAVEDAAQGLQRPKFDRYAGPRLPQRRTRVHLDVATGQLVTGEVAAFITPDGSGHRPPGRRLPHRRAADASGTTAPT